MLTHLSGGTFVCILPEHLGPPWRERRFKMEKKKGGKTENKLTQWKQQKHLCIENPAVLKSGRSSQ